MGWFNWIGLLFMAFIMVPNLIYAITEKADGFKNYWNNKPVELFEQISRYACFLLMAINIPYTYFDIIFEGGLTVYVVVNTVLVAAYLVCWGILWHKTNMAKAVLLSVIPSIIFIFSGVMLQSIPLIVFALIFAPCHIVISCKNAYLAAKNKI